jgi:hypothetical protein
MTEKFDTSYNLVRRLDIALLPYGKADASDRN